jgi:glycosyltransferase involved in cell wall biosynthesis
MATLNRSEEIRQFLDSLAVQTYKNYRLIIIDQNKDDRVLNITESYKNTVDIVHIKSDTAGLSFNRNIGLRYIAESENQDLSVDTGNIVAFPDDDCEYQPDTLQNIADFFDNNPDYSLYTCSTREKNGEKTILQSKTNDCLISVHNFMQTGISFTVFVRTRAIRDFAFDLQMGVGTRFGSGEESDLLLFLLKNRHKGRFHSRHFIFHPYKTDDAAKAYQYGKGFGALFKKSVVVYKFYYLFFVFLLIISKETFKLCFYPFSRIRAASVKGRLYGFVQYKPQ